MGNRTCDIFGTLFGDYNTLRMTGLCASSRKIVLSVSQVIGCPPRQITSLQKLVSTFHSQLNSDEKQFLKLDAADSGLH